MYSVLLTVRIIFSFESNQSSTIDIVSLSFLDGGPKDGPLLSLQKSNVWNMIALSAKDQLRQRMAWALSQILIVTSEQISEVGLSEAYLNYYDIFVRNAFGSYRDVLKEVSQSPMMAEILSFLESKSTGKTMSTKIKRLLRIEQIFKTIFVNSICIEIIWAINAPR